MKKTVLLRLVPMTPLVLACSSEPSEPSKPGNNGSSCAWAVRADKQTLNIAYPDTGATYWAISYSLAPGETLELHGTFPSARYASFISYAPSGGALDVLTDRDIVPDPGSTNPFATGDRTQGGTYTLVISGDDAQRDAANVLGARSASGSASSDAGIALGAVNLLGSGGADAVGGTVLYRVYVPDDPGDPTGGKGLPALTLIAASGDRRAIPTCGAPGPSPVAAELVNTFGPPTDRPAPPQPIFIRPGADSNNLFPNPDNVYIATIAQHQPGRVVVVQGAAPSFPDPPNGRALGGGEQVRYWSLCTDEYRKPYPVSFCIFDRNVIVDSTGNYTFVISTPEDRPANATDAQGVTWLDWGSIEVNNLILMRHMLASPTFPESAINVAPGALATTTMGTYAPRGIYCDKLAFEQGGAAACAP